MAFSIWLGANIFSVNVPGYRDGGWYFNLFAWHFLLSVGVVIGMSRMNGSIGGLRRRSRPLLALVCLFLLFGFLHARPWAQFPIPVLKDFVIFDQNIVGTINKSYLSVWRFLHILCLAYLVDILVPIHATWIQRTLWARQFSAIGRMPLMSFVAASLASTIGTMIFEQFGTAPAYQIIVILVGGGTILAIARLALVSDVGRRADYRAVQMTT